MSRIAALFAASASLTRAAPAGYCEYVCGGLSCDAYAPATCDALKVAGCDCAGCHCRGTNSSNATSAAGTAWARRAAPPTESR
mmetsp:Transcript_17178/g.52831  ORF Transcript_17178/g.52831 Transcript_17178/m.52831 type:complete len:83 (-) Transcript_17178:10-258(-)